MIGRYGVGAVSSRLRVMRLCGVGCALPQVPHCGPCARVLLRQVKESFLNDAGPDPAKSPRDAGAESALRLTQAVQRAKSVIAWERSWPDLARLLTVAGLFLVASWAGLWLALPPAARAGALAVFAAAALAALFPLVKFRWPGRDEALSRLDRGTGLRHGPATPLTDTLPSQHPVGHARRGR